MSPCPNYRQQEIRKQKIEVFSEEYKISALIDSPSNSKSIGAIRWEKLFDLEVESYSTLPGTILTTFSLFLYKIVLPHIANFTVRVGPKVPWFSAST